MNYLAIDTSGSHLTVAISYNGKDYGYFNKLCGIDHSSTLMPAIDKLITENGIDLKNMDFFASTIGAGSFTGIRIGVSTVKALCYAFSKKCLAVTSFDTLTYSNRSGKVLAVIDAKHDNYYVTGYNDGTIVLKPKFIAITELMELAKEYKLVSSAELPIETEIIDLKLGLFGAINNNIALVTDDIEALAPLYIRKSQAEENR